MFGGSVVSIGAFLAEFSLIFVTSLVTGVAWHLAVYGAIGGISAYASVGALTGLFYTLPFLFRSEYQVDRLLASTRSLTKVLNIWTYAFFCLGVIAFLTKMTDGASRGWLALFFVLGGCGTLIGHSVLRQGVRMMVANGLVAPRRLLVIGSPSHIADFVARNDKPSAGIEVVATRVLPDASLPKDGSGMNTWMTDVLGETIQRARSLEIGEILILADGECSHGLVSRIADRFLDLPVAVHLGRLPFTEHFPNLRVGQLGTARTLAVRPAPLSTYQMALKRVLDVTAASIGLLLLAPLFVVVAILIKLDSSGPVFFRQRRRGFNLKEFTIWKFRTMTTMDDGDLIPQATAGDPRVTRVGAILRRYNIDEIPQLLNVLIGQMSLVGPRPHAVAHDRHYETVIKRYRRRLNVKPGITGWAQVNGFRGKTETDHAMRSRIAHDLHYIDHWSVAFDLYIILLTVISPKAFKNAV